MNKLNDIYAILREYSLPEIVQMKVEQLAEDRKKLEIQETEAQNMLSGTILPKPTPKPPLKQKFTGHGNSRAAKIRAIIAASGKKGITNSEIANLLDWGDDSEKSIGFKRIRVKDATKQMVRLEQVKIKEGSDPNLFYID